MKAIYAWHPEYVDSLAVRMRPASGGADEHFFTHDALYNVTSSVSDANDQVVERYHYSPYGEAAFLTSAFAVQSASTIGQEHLYTGRERDAETGLQLNRHRWYHASLGRWVSRDPIGYEGDDPNLYGYVQVSPCLYSDEFGLQAIMPAPVRPPVRRPPPIRPGQSPIEPRPIPGYPMPAEPIWPPLGDPIWDYPKPKPQPYPIGFPRPEPSVGRPGSTCNARAGESFLRQFGGYNPLESLSNEDLNEKLNGKPLPRPSGGKCPTCEEMGNTLPPMEIRIDRVPPSTPHSPCKGDHTHFIWWHWDQKPYPSCECNPHKNERISCDE